MLVNHRTRQMPVLPLPASQPVPRANCATHPAFRTEAATAEVKRLRSRSALPQAEPCANRVVTTRRQAVVTTRKLPQPPWSAHGLQQVTAPSDALSARPKRRPCNAICPDPLPAGHISRGAVWRTPSPGTRAHPTNRLAAASDFGANAACRGGQTEDLGTRREWCPVSLATPATPRRSGRTETLT